MKTKWHLQLLVYSTIVLGALAFLFPFVYMIMTSFIKGAYSLPRPKEVFSVVPNLYNYQLVWGKNNFARFTFPGKEFLFRMFLLTMMIPGVINIIPQFLIIKSFGLVNTYWGLWLIYIGGGVVGSTFFLRGFFQSIPKEYEESVLIDGGGNWRIFWNIYLPQSMPAIATLAVLSFQGTWEEYFTALVIIKDEALRTLPVALLMFNDKYATNYSWVFAASIIALIPTVLLYIVFQKRFVQGGFNEGGVKG